MSPRRLPLRRAAAAGLLAALLAAGCTPAVERRPNVVLVLVDTLRADRLPFHGAPRDTAPFLGELASRSLVFENAWSPSSWTLPAAVSVLTSVHPSQHGVTTLAGLELEPGEAPVPVACIPDELETLPEILRAAGYRTFGVVSNVLVGEAVGFDRGFDRFVQLEDEDADAVDAVVERWRDELLGSEPFFLYVHYFDPHDTFHARAPWFDVEASAAGWPPARTAEADVDALDWLLTRIDPPPPALAGKRAADLTPAERDALMAWVKAAYDSEIGFVDARIRRLFERLALDDAVVVFLADHGEEFWEHGALTHGHNLYAESLRVPLLVHLPHAGAPRGRVADHVSTLDVLPTLRRALALPSSDQDRGQDLLGAGERQPVYTLLAGKSGQHELDRDLRAIVLGDHKLIALAGGAVELYDVARDPLERVDLAAQRPELAADLLGRLEAIERASPSYPRTSRLPPPPGEALREHLRGIGYAGDR